VQIDIISTLDSLRRAQGDWEDVYRDDPEAQCFLSWNWMINWLGHVD